MEFRRPMRDETPDEGLVARHRRDIFPLLHQRWRFAGSQGFRLLTALDRGGEVSDVFAYREPCREGPRVPDERRSLVVYLNRYPRADVRVDGVAAALSPGRTIRRGPSSCATSAAASTTCASCATCARAGSSCRWTAIAASCSSASRWSPDPGWRPGWPRWRGASGWRAWRTRTPSLRWLGRAAVARRSVRSSPPRTVQAASCLAPRDCARSSARRSGPVSEAGDLVPPSGDSLTSSGRQRRPTSRVAATARRSALPRLRVRSRGCSLEPSPAGSLFAAAVAELAGDGDPERAVAAFDAWGGRGRVGRALRATGSSDGVAWRVVELARAMLAVPPGASGRLPSSTRPALPRVVRDVGVRAATGWNDGRDDLDVSREGWVELAGCRRRAGLRSSVSRASRQSAARSSSDGRRRAPATGTEAVDGRSGDGVSRAAVSRGARRSARDLVADIATCRRCPRLVAWREDVARERVARLSRRGLLGPPRARASVIRRARLLLVGLAPAAHGGNRTGRVFTGDNPGGSGELLFAALHRAGFATLRRSVASDDGLDC